MASQTDICNLALQKLGAKRITSINEDSVNARACLASYSHCLAKSLRAHPWRFAIDRASIAADAEEPAFGKSYSYTLPAGFLRLISPYPEATFNDLDYEIEGRKIYTNISAPLQIRYIYLISDTSLMDPLYVEVLACEMAEQMCEQLTQSNSKKASITADKQAAIKEARRTNAIESISAVPPEDSWVTVRD